jgi:16S rRNA (cytosine967-C5)-methyltransferase
VLLAVDRGTATLASEIERARQPLSDPRDRALLLELATGTLRWRQQLDALIAGASRRSVRDIDPRALAVLRIGAYQWRHLERIPAHAVVHESVDVVRALGAPRAAGFVNAVLRALIRRGPALPLPPKASASDPRERQLRYLTTTLSHPAWLMERWLDRYGYDATERWCVFNNTPPAVTVRSAGHLPAAHLLERLAEAGIQAQPAPFVADAIRLAAGELGRVPADLRAELRVQDEGAQLVARMADAKPGKRVLDVCAAPGGKTLVCAMDMGLEPGGPRDPSGSPPHAAHDRSLLVAADYRPARVNLLAETIRHAGLPVPIVRLDARRPLPFLDRFDVVILDVPCSGLGTLRRDPDLKWRRSADDLPRLAEEAGQMLQAAAAAVRPGGRLVYATCSSEPDENELVVARFLGGAPDFAVSPVSPAVPGIEDGLLKTTPFTHNLDAFFAVVLVRQTAT